jgi:Tfp pilus assembly protein PilO
MKTFSRQYCTKICTVWCIFLVVLLLSYLFVLRPQRKTRDKVLSELAKVEQEYNLNKQSVYAQARNSLGNSVEELSEQLSDFVFSKDKQGTFSLEISRIAEENGISSPVVRDRTAGVKGKKQEYILENRLFVQFESDFNRFARFLNSLERHNPIIFVDNFQLMEGSDENTAKINMMLTILANQQDQI